MGRNGSLKMSPELLGPKTEAANMVHAEKYRAKGETFREAMNRIAAATQDNHDHYMNFREILLDMRFMPAGRIQAAMGSLKTITAYNCFVMGTIHDSFTDGPTQEEINSLPEGVFPPESIMDTAKFAAMTMRQGGGVGYDISTLRPSGDMIKGVQSMTDGPMAFAPIYDAVCRATSSAGNRRGAQMLVMRSDHPDIEAFIRAKHVADKNIPYHMRPLRGFNMSIAVTDELMEAVDKGSPYTLKFGGRDYREVDSLALWEMIMRSTYDWAEPGVLFIDTINRMNNLWYCENIAATNPCGEQPLPPYGACLLGSINAVKYLVKNASGQYHFDWDLLNHDIPHIVRAMDNVIDRTRYPLKNQEIEAKNKRRMGLGITGLANALEAMGMPYGSHLFLDFEAKLMKFIANKCYQASALLAKEKGSFKLFDKEKYLAGQFIQTLEEDTIGMIDSFGIRNSHLTSVAPTGTISFSADNISSGIEPVLAYQQKRRVIMPEGPIVVDLEDYGVSFLGTRGKTVDYVTPKEHVDVLVTAQRYVDSAVSKTCNVPTNIGWDDFKDIYRAAYLAGAKGCTTYRPAGNYDEVIKAADEKKADEAQEKDFAEGEACGFDPVTGARTGKCAE